MKRLFLLLLALAVPASAVTYTTPVAVAGCVANAANNCTWANFGGHSASVGDWVYYFAFRTATTAPTAPASTTNLDTASASSSSFRSGCYILASTTPAAVTATNATRISVTIYHSAYQAGNVTANCPASVGFHTSAGASGTTSTYSFTGGTLTNTNGHSLVIGSVGSSAAPCIPTSLPNNVQNSTDIIDGDTGATGVSTFTTSTCTGTTGNWKTDTVELMPLVTNTATVTAINNATASAGTCINTSTPGVGVGHGAVVVNWGSGTSNVPTAMTDSASPANTYNTTDATQSDAGDNVIVAISSGYMANAIAASGTITSTIAGGACVAYDISTMASASWLDQTASNDNSYGTSQSSGTTSATANQPNVNIAAFAGASPCPTVTWQFPWIPLSSISTGSRCVMTGWKEVTTTGTQNATITISASDGMAAVIGSYKETGASATFVPQVGAFMPGP